MKIHRLVQMLGLINESGRLASDMYELNDKMYRSESKNEEIPISHMDFQYMVRAFIKLNDKVTYFKKVSEDSFKQSVDDLDSLEAQENIIAGLRSQVETLRELVDEKDKLLEKETKDKASWKNLYYNECTTIGHYYTFSEVPQDEEGKEFVKNCRKYLNRESYNIRVKGQHLKKELYGQGKAYHGANIEDCTHLRVYIDAI